MLFFRFSQAVKDSEIAVFGMLNLLRDYFLRFAKEPAAFRMSNHYMINRVVFDVIGSNFASECSFIECTAVLGTNHDSGVDESLYARQV